MIEFSLLIALIISFILIPKKSETRNLVSWSNYLSEVRNYDLILARISRRISGNILIKVGEGGTATRLIESQLRAGITYGASLDVFLSVVLVSLLLSASLLLVALGLNINGILLFIIIFISLVISARPWKNLIKLARNRSILINEALPDFIDLLVMVLPTTSPLSALAFTAERAKGEISKEVKALVEAISSRSMTDLEAFDFALDRLSTPEARTFITSLRNTYIEGTPVVDSLTQQSDALRRAIFQQQRAVAKRMPTNLIVVFAVHFMPLLIILALLPVLSGLGQDF
jgi:hypothetical protein